MYTHSSRLFAFFLAAPSELESSSLHLFLEEEVVTGRRSSGALGGAAAGGEAREGSSAAAATPTGSALGSGEMMLAASALGMVAGMAYHRSAIVNTIGQ